MLGEAEVVLGFGAMILILCMFAVQDGATALQYLDSRNFIEPMFVFAIMVIAGTQPILQFAMLCARTVYPATTIRWGTTSLRSPLFLCSVIVAEPTAMTLAALILRNNSRGISVRPCTPRQVFCS